MGVGTKPKYNNCIDFDGMCEAYFEECDDNTFFDGTNYIPFPEPYLKSGLALFLELTTESLRLYSKDKDSPFFAIIKRNYDRIQNDLEKRAIMHGKQAVGCLFNLKCNFNMIEASRIVVDKGTSFDDITDDELENRIQSLKGEIDSSEE